MIVLLDTNHDHDVASEEIGMEYGELLTPLTRRLWRGARFAIDNGGYSNLNIPGFMRIIEKQLPHREKCIFVAVPDMVYSAMRTLELFKAIAPKLEGWPLAYVCQNGQENVEIPWSQISAIFIGGDDRFKLGDETVRIIRVAKAFGKWVHIGRVNSHLRVDKFESLGADSIDGTGISKYTGRRTAIRDAQDLFDGEKK